MRSQSPKMLNNKINRISKTVNFGTRVHVQRVHVQRNRKCGVNARALTWALLVLLLTALVLPATAADSPPAGSPTTTGQAPAYLPCIEASLSLLFTIGQSVVAFFGRLVAPLMGITSILWLMMRNDAAINPQASWM